MHRDGFDVVIGNPPFVEARVIRDKYTTDKLPLAETRNLFAIFGHRSSVLSESKGRLGMIFPISSISTPRMLPLMNHFVELYSQIWISNYAVRPSKLFLGADMNLAILITSFTSVAQAPAIHTTDYLRWHNRFRPHLFRTLSFFPSELQKESSSIPKIGSRLERSILEKIQAHSPLSNFRSNSSSSEPIYYHSGGRYFRKCLNEKLSAEYKELKVTASSKPALISLLSSSIYYWYWIVHSDCYHVTKRDIDNLFVPEQLVSDHRIGALSERLLQDLWDNSEVRLRSRADGSIQREVNFQVARSKNILDKIDTVIASHYGLSDDELDFVKSFDEKYRFPLDKTLIRQPQLES